MKNNSSIVVSVTSAVALSAEEKKEITAFVERVTGNESFTLETHVDSSVLGGLRIEIGDTVLDTTISEQLNKLTKSLLTVS